MFNMYAFMTVDLFNVNSGGHKALLKGTWKLIQISVAFSLFDLRVKPKTDVILIKEK